MTLILPRRRFLTGLASVITAPAVVRAEILMPIKVWTPRALWRIPSSEWTDAEWDATRRDLMSKEPSEWTEIEWRLAQDMDVCLD
jgi:hypothetical protein